MKISVVGSGYVGLVSGACLAEVGNDVLCMDVDVNKINILKRGGIPIYEPGLEEMVNRNVAAGRLRFTTDAEESAKHGTIQILLWAPRRMRMDLPICNMLLQLHELLGSTCKNIK